MKFLTSLALLVSLCVIPFSVNSADKLKPRPSEWVAFNMSSNNGELFYDKNSLRIEQADSDGVIDSGALLITYTTPKEVQMAKGDPRKAISKITIVMIDCKSGLTTPVLELWFDVEFPKKGDKAIAALDLTKGPMSEEDLITFSPGSVVHKALCPIYT